MLSGCVYAVAYISLYTSCGIPIDAGSNSGCSFVMVTIDFGVADIIFSVNVYTRKLLFKFSIVQISNIKNFL